MINFSIIIPIFNEEENIYKLVVEINEILKKTDFIYEVVIIDDCSTDNTYNTINSIKNKYDINYILNEKNMGQRFSFFIGMKNSKYNNIVTIDGDGQNNPADIPKLVNFFIGNKNLKLISGIRTKRKDSLIKIFSSKFANTIRSTLLKDRCADTGCSLKFFNKKIFLNFPYFNGIHRFLPALFVASKCEVMYISVDHRPRKLGISKYGTFDRLYKGIFDIIKVIKIINIIKKNA